MLLCMTTPLLVIGPRPMSYHGPGWEATSFNGTLYQLWAPQTQELRDRYDVGEYRGTAPPRTRWTAAWTNEDGHQGDLREADSAGEAMHLIFSNEVANEFVRFAGLPV